MSSPFKIWVKYGEGQPAEIVFDGGNVHALKKAIKKELSPDLNETAIDRIILRKHDEEADLRPSRIVDDSFANTDETPLQVIVQRKDRMEEERGKQGN